MKTLRKSTIKAPEQRQWRRSSVFIVNFEQILHILLFPFADFEQLNSGWLMA